MNRVSDQAAGFWTPRPPSLDGLLTRLERLSSKPEFMLQRELAHARALKPYVEGGAGRLVAPLEQEIELASLYLFCDYYPEDGQLTLIEQLRDVITEHIPEEERQWLDPLKHSYLDVLKPISLPQVGQDLVLQSLADGTRVVLPGGEFAKDLTVDRPLLTRVIHDPNSPLESDRAVWAGCGITVSQADAKALLDVTSDWRRDMEMSTGSFALGEWKEFTKRFGYMVLWAFAEQRLAALIDAAVHVEYRTADDQPYLYAIALYDHHEHRLFTDMLSGMTDLSVEKSDSTHGQGATGRLPTLQQWVQRESGLLVAKLTLTAYQLLVECDRPQRLDHLKHRLAAELGFSLHFRGETVVPPVRQLSVADLMSDTLPRLVVTPEEDRALLDHFLGKVYLEWPDQPHVALSGQTPRHAAVAPAMRGKVGELIDDMERHDPGRQRLGKTAFDYNRLRAHVGLEEKPG
ncbi:MAG: hypothetical protein OEV01_06945 [Nitrospira sp.]|nr:hypothetical protein [Nitrospira sp.]MDH5192843.1 hypothetical protein [Nitrospira sp.]